MALGAIQFRALEDRLVHLVLVQQIKDRALHGIEGHDLHSFAAMDRTHIDIVIVVKRARMLGRDLGILETGLGEDQGLRIHRHLQKIQHRFQIAMLFLISQLGIAPVDLFLQHRHRIAEIEGAVMDRRIAIGNITLVAHRDLRLGRKH